MVTIFYKNDMYIHRFYSHGDMNNVYTMILPGKKGVSINRLGYSIAIYLKYHVLWIMIRIILPIQEIVSMLSVS